MSEKAQYRPAAAEVHRNNPLIEALPVYMDRSPREILKMLSLAPQMPHDRGASLPNG